jgi:ribosomal protein S18 acetylase RimI-like enzyme
MKNIVEYTSLIKELIQSESEYLNISDVDSYVNKIINNADFAIDNDKGFIAYYANDFTSKKAYITMVIIDKKYKGKQIGKKLLNQVLEDLRNRGFLSCQLEVDPYNHIAYNLYLSFGFFKIDEGDKKIKMEIIL